MKKLTIIFFVSILFFSCEKSEKKENEKLVFKADQFYEDGTVMFKSVSMGDTIIDRDTFHCDYAIQYDENGNKIREGKYIDDSAIGYHTFYKNDEIYAIRNYIHWPAKWLSTMYSLDAEQPSKYITENKTYLNEVYYLKNNFTVLIEKSLFPLIEFGQKNAMGDDSLTVDITVYNGLIDIDSLIFYFEAPNDSNIAYERRVFGNKIRYSQIVHDENTKIIKGLIIIKGRGKNTPPNDPIFVKRVMYFNKEDNYKRNTTQK